MEAWDWIPPAGWVNFGVRGEAVWVAAIEAYLASRVAWITPLIMASISTFSVNCGGGAVGIWGTGAVAAGAGKSGQAEISSDASPHEALRCKLLH